MKAATVSRRASKSKSQAVSKSVAYRLQKGHRFHYVSWNGTVMPVLAKNSVDACSLFNIWCGVSRDFDMGYSDGQCGIIKISAEIPDQYCMWGGRRNGGVPQVRHIIVR